MAKIKITKEQAIMLENLKKNKVIKITESQYKKLVESLNPGQKIDRAFQTAMQGDKDFMKNRNKLDEGLWESFINELYGINESSEKVYESLIKIMEACGYVENGKLSKAKFGGDKKMAKDVILGGLQTLHETGSPFMAMEAMEDVFKSQLTQRSGEKPSQQQIANNLKDIRAGVLKGRAERGEPLSVGRKGDETPTPEPVDPNQLKMDLSEIDGEEDAPTKMVPINPESEDAVDTITMDVPLFIRALEYSREDAQNDLDLHTIAQNAVVLNKEYGMLNMDNYGEIFGDAEEVEPEPAHESFKVFIKEEGDDYYEQAIEAAKKMYEYIKSNNIPTRIDIKGRPEGDTDNYNFIIVANGLENNGGEIRVAGRGTNEDVIKNYVNHVKDKFNKEYGDLFDSSDIYTEKQFNGVITMSFKLVKKRPQSPELNELESEDTPKQYTCNGPQRVEGKDILNYEPFKSLPDTRAEVKSMGASLVSLPSLDTGGATIVIFSQDDLSDHSFEYNGEKYNTPGYIDEFKRKYKGEEPIFCDIQVNTDRNIPNAKIVNMPGMKSLDPRGQGPLDEKEIDEVTAMGGSGGVFGGDGVNPKSGGSTFPVAPLQKKNESKIYEALGALKKK
jgi:hypothetical protein